MAAPSGGGNNLFARDAVGFALHYNMGDYKMIGSGSDAFIGLPNASFHAVYTPMYNGNIIGMTVNYDSSIRAGISTGNFIYGFGQPRTRMYKYDKLNRLRAVMDLPFSGNGLVEYNAAGGLSESFTYDGNGNILRLTRNTPTNVSPPSGAGHFQAVDNLTYNYKAGTNRLRHVGETINKDLFNFDIDPQVADNYVYDEIGNMVKDQAEKIDTILWTVYSKIDSISKNGGATQIKYRYDGAGNRISKIVKVGSNTTETWYVRDAQGNVLNVYSYNAGEGLSLAETHLYGSSRLGIMNRSINVSDGTGLEQISYSINGDVFWGKKYNFDRGNKLFETSNHLGNVLIAFSDRKKAFKNATNPNVIAYYKADIRSANDYYAFGAPIPIFSYNSSAYRYGFNGQEKSDEIKGSGNSYTAEFWEYDPRLGRRWNLDPKPTVGVSEYATFFNNPIWNNDVYGDSPSLRIGIFLDFESKYKEVYQVDKDYANLNPQLSVTIPYFNITLIALNYEKDRNKQDANRERTRKLNGGMRGTKANKTDAHEAAPALSKQGGGANNSQNIMRIVDRSLNRSHGNGLKNAVKNLQDGDPLIMVLIPEKKKDPVFVPVTVIVPDIKPIPIAKPVLEPGFWEKVRNYSILTRAMMTTSIQTGTDLLGEKLRTAQQIQNARECACP